MRKVVTLTRVTVDGFFAGANDEIDWFIHEDELDQAAHELMQPDTILFGRHTYQMFEGYWPHIANDPHASVHERAIAQELNQMSKVVFSNSLDEVTWENTTLIQGQLLENVKSLKQRDGGDLMIVGSGSIVRQLTDAGLIDEYVLQVTPVVLGAGKPLFKDVRTFPLKLLAARSLPSGNQILHYKVGE